jgi:hypothetical protein
MALLAFIINLDFQIYGGIIRTHPVFDVLDVQKTTAVGSNFQVVWV